MPTSSNSAIPLGMKGFLVICAALAFLPWIGIVNATSADPAQVLMAVPAEYRGIAHQRLIQQFALMVAVWSALVVALAWFAGVRHHNWARWTIAVVFVLSEAVPLLTGYRIPALDWQHVAMAGLEMVLKLAAIVLLFAGSAKPWFRKEAAA